MQANGIEICNPSQKRGLAAAAAALRSMSKNAKAGSRPVGLAAATAVLEAKGIDPSDPAHKPGIMAAAVALDGLKDAPSTLPVHKVGITQGAATLLALSANPNDREQHAGLAAADVGLARLEATAAANPASAGKHGLAISRKCLASMGEEEPASSCAAQQKSGVQGLDDMCQLRASIYYMIICLHRVAGCICSVLFYVFRKRLPIKSKREVTHPTPV